MYERFTDRSRKVMQLANQEAQRLNHEWIGAEHIVLGLIKSGDGVACSILKDIFGGLPSLGTIRDKVEKINPSGKSMVSTGKLPQTDRAKAVIQFAIQEAKKLNHNYVGTEHLLLGLCLEVSIYTLIPELLPYSEILEVIQKQLEKWPAPEKTENISALENLSAPEFSKQSGENPFYTELFNQLRELNQKQMKLLLLCDLVNQVNAKEINEDLIVLTKGEWQQICAVTQYEKQQPAINVWNTITPQPERR